MRCAALHPLRAHRPAHRLPHVPLSRQATQPLLRHARQCQSRPPRQACPEDPARHVPGRALCHLRHAAAAHALLHCHRPRPPNAALGAGNRVQSERDELPHHRGLHPAVAAAVCGHPPGSGACGRVQGRHLHHDGPRAQHAVREAARRPSHGGGALPGVQDRVGGGAGGAPVRVRARAHRRQRLPGGGRALHGAEHLQGEHHPRRQRRHPHPGARGRCAGGGLRRHHEPPRGHQQRGGERGGDRRAHLPAVRPDGAHGAAHGVSLPQVVHRVHPRVRAAARTPGGRVP
mmetsp:Transcript_13944/g.29793  ORF Transcript_13944/g.29793 Transcript_13944/m.29793 type:complete len:288 (-) Transcript_13944:370-1233(-)